jgi:predicted nucleic acid-binding protein
VRSFIDTNILIYADDREASAKQAVALSLVAEHLRAGTGVISTQVLHEFVNAATRKLALPLDLIRSRVRLYSRFEVATASVAAVLAALELRTLHQVSYWDALILQAAGDSGCVRLLTEDMQAGAMIGGVHVVNPFAPPAAPATSRAVAKKKRR